MHSAIPGSLIKSLNEYFFLKKQAFTQSTVYSLGAGLSLNFLFDPTGYVPANDQIYNAIFFEVPAIAATGGPVLIEFFKSPVISAPGTPVSPQPFNRDGSSPREAQLIITQGPTITNSGEDLSQLLLPATSAGAVGTPARVADPLPYSFNGFTLLMRLTNEGNAEIRMQIRNNWYEV